MSETPGTNVGANVESTPTPTPGATQVQTGYHVWKLLGFSILLVLLIIILYNLSSSGTERLANTIYTAGATQRMRGEFSSSNQGSNNFTDSELTEPWNIISNCRKKT
jgi:hypothetical protein